MARCRRIDRDLWAAHAVRGVQGKRQSVRIDLDAELAQLLRDSAPADLKEKLAKKEVPAAPAPLMQGPSVPDTALNQDSVDDLLADLGF